MNLITYKVLIDHFLRWLKISNLYAVNQFKCLFYVLKLIIYIFCAYENSTISFCIEFLSSFFYNYYAFLFLNFILTVIYKRVTIYTFCMIFNSWISPFIKYALVFSEREARSKSCLYTLREAFFSRLFIYA